MTLNYEEIGRNLGKLVADKQQAYGDSFGKSRHVLEVLFPDGVKPDQYRDLLCITRIIDKLFRLATKPDYNQESPYLDIMGYGLLGYAKSQESKQNEN